MCVIAGRRPRRDRGQALLVAVLVLFGVATLAALFAALVGAQIVQVTRYADVTALRNIAEAGLRFANEQLVYSKAGGDWRPGVMRPDGVMENRPQRVGNGQVTLRVAYGPLPGNLQSRFLTVSATATFPDNPFLSYTILGMKPLLLTDYARFITDRYELRQPATLGVTGVELAGQPRTTDYGGAYQFGVWGPIRSNTDLVWYGPSRVDLSNSYDALPGASWWNTWARLGNGGLPGLLRDDRIEVAGEMRSGALGLDPDLITDPVAQWARYREGLADHPLALYVNPRLGWPAYAENVFAPENSLETWYYERGFTDQADFQPLPNAWRVLAFLPKYRTVFGEPLDPPDYSAPRVNPPRMDVVDPDMNTNRYLVLTRDSGEWFADADGNWHNRGEFGWGWVHYGGIYVDNGTEIQYEHDLEELRLNWVGSYTVPGKDGERGADDAANWWDRTGRYYAPPGVEIVLHGESPSCPYVELIRHDLNGTMEEGYYWRDLNGAEIPADGTQPALYSPPAGGCARPNNQDEAINVIGARAIFPFPPNGVIYAEGNVRVRGIMPPRRRAEIETKPRTEYFADDLGTANRFDRSRRFDLQVVSGGTIYVEGDLLTPAGAQLYPPGTDDRPEDLIRWDRDNGSRVALIARDYVCLNTTALHPRPVSLYATDADSRFNDSQPIYPDPETGGHPPYLLFQGDTDAEVNLDENARTYAGRQPTVPPSLTFRYVNFRLSTPSLSEEPYLGDLRLIMGHSGWYTPDVGGEPGETTEELDNAEAAVEVELRINGAVQSWQQDDSATYTFRSDGNAPADGSDHWYLEPDRDRPFDGNDYLEFLPLLYPEDRRQEMGLLDVEGNRLLNGWDSFTLSAWITPVWQEVDGKPRWIIKPRELGYVLGPLAVTPPRLNRDTGEAAPPLPVRVEAVVYAQNGSWFVLPGPWFNEDPDELPPVGSDAQETQQWYRGRIAPAYHEPLNLQISFSGAIAENMPAPMGDVVDWTSKWCGPFTTAPAIGEAYLRYEYDPLLRWATRSDASGQLYPRFPSLLLTPDLLIWGERVSGFTGAGV